MKINYRGFFKNNAFIGFVLFVIAFLTYQRIPLPTYPGIDFGVYAYQAQQMVDGVPPYVSLFNGKFPMGTFVLVPGVWLARLMGWHDVHGIQFWYTFFGAGMITIIYLISVNMTRSKMAALVAAFSYFSFSGAWENLFSCDPKTTASLFMMIYAYHLLKRNWIWSGIWLGGTILCWQPAGILIIPGLIVCCLPQAKRRMKNLLFFIGSVGTVFASIFMLFWYWGALDEMFQATIVYPLFYHYGAAYNPLKSNLVPYIAEYVNRDTVLVCVGTLAYFGCFVLNMIFQKGDRWYRNLPIILCFSTVIVWSCIDFRDYYRDMYPLLPFACLGIGLFFADMVTENSKKRVALCCALIIAAYTTTVQPPLKSDKKEEVESTIQRLNDIVATYAPNKRIVEIGLPEVAVYLNIRQKFPYLYWGGGHKRYIDKNIPGGLSQLREEIDIYDPEVVFVNRFYRHDFSKHSKRSYRSHWSHKKIYTYIKKD